MKIRGVDLKAGIKVKTATGGHRVMDRVSSPDADRKWCEYREYDAEGKLVGHYAESFWHTDYFVKL